MAIFNPTPQQQAAIDCPDSIVVTACPGSGKTTVMSEKIRLVTASQPGHKGVIAITFTRKASEELKKRCKKHSHDTKLSFFGTIDSFCLKEIIVPFLGRIWGGKPSNCKIIKRLETHHRGYLSQNYTSPTERELYSDDGFQRLYNDGILWMSSFSALSLFILNHSTSAQRYLKARYSHVFIDEYQDSSEAQHELFIKLHQLGLVATAVGDIDQSIYRFRGSQPELLLELTRDTVNFKHFKLSLNHRCHPSIINYSSRILDPSCDLITHKDDIRVYRRRLNGNLIEAANQITPWITGWLESGQIKRACDIAVLAKKEISLREFSSGLGVNYRLYKDTPLHEIGTEPSDIYLDFLLYKHTTILTAQDFIDKYSNRLVGERIAGLRKTLKAIRNEQDVNSFIEKCCSFMRLMGYMNFDEENDAVRSVWANESLIKLFMPVTDDEIQLMTLHKSKGLEFKIVLHLDMEEWSFPHRIPGVNRSDINYPSLEEDTNLHYVGITRAEEYCILVQTNMRRNANGGYAPSSPSYFLNLPQLTGLYQ